MNLAQLDTQQILAFLAVAEQGSFSGAARLLHITQPAISKRIGQLEQVLGLSLFDRVARRVILTESGERLLPAARAIRQDLDDLVNLAATPSGTLSGHLDLALSHYAGLHLLPAALERFNCQHPAVLLNLAFMDSEAAIRAVQQGRVAMAYATLPPRMPDDVLATAIWHERLQPMVARRHLTGAASVDWLAHIGRRLPVILPAAFTSTRQAIDHWLDQIGVVPPAVIEVNQLDSIALLTATGVGWSVLPETLERAALSTLPTDTEGLPRRSLGVIRNRARAENRLASAFHEVVMASR